MNPDTADKTLSRLPFAERLRASLAEMLAYARGETKLPTTWLTLPAPPPNADAEVDAASSHIPDLIQL